MSLTAMDGCRIPTEVTRRLVAPGFPCTSDLPQQKSSKCAEACMAMEPPSRPGTQPSGDVSRVLTRGPLPGTQNRKALSSGCQSASDTWSHPGWLILEGSPVLCSPPSPPRPNHPKIPQLQPDMGMRDKPRHCLRLDKLSFQREPPRYPVWPPSPGHPATVEICCYCLT